MKSKPPRPLEAVFQGLEFQGDDRAAESALRRLSDEEWRELFDRWDSARLIPLLCDRRPAALPQWARERVAADRERNALRFARVMAVYARCAAALHAAGVEHVVLKGFAQWPSAVGHPRLRPQSDVDLYCPGDHLAAARAVFTDLGYRPDSRYFHPRADHLPQLAPAVAWEWRGDFYDPEMPVGFELHFRLWNAGWTRIALGDEGGFWERRVVRRCDADTFPALSKPDSLAYTALNVARDTFYELAAIPLVYDLAWFLERAAGEEEFWEDWARRGSARLRALQTVALGLARSWFRCRWPARLEAEAARLPAPARVWLETRARPLRLRRRNPPKDGLWLHLAFLSSGRDRRAILWQRLFPTRPPNRGRASPAASTGQLRGTADAALAPKSAQAAVARSRSNHPWPSRFRYAILVAQRLWHHAAALPGALLAGLDLWRRARIRAPRGSAPDPRLRPEFWRFLAVSTLFNVGVMIFYFLFNLYLLDRGFHDRLLGALAGAGAAGGLAGTLPAGWLVHRAGPRRAAVACIALVPLLLALRALAQTPGALLALSFLGGAALSLWAVLNAPIIARCTDEHNRARGFSLVCSLGIGAGVVGSLAGGELPHLLASAAAFLGGPGRTPLAALVGSPAAAKRAALLIGCSLAVTALWPALALPREDGLARPARERRFWPRGPFIRRFLLAVGFWALVTGSFSPLFNAFFAERIHLGLRAISWVAAAAQLAQTAAVLAAPRLFRRWGAIRGLLVSQLAAGLCLALLAATGGGWSAGAVYALFSALLWMSEPGLYALLMNRVAPEERPGAATLNFLVIGVAQGVAGTLAGAAFSRFGFPPVMLAIAALALVAGLSWPLLLARQIAPADAALEAEPTPAVVV